MRFPAEPTGLGPELRACPRCRRQWDASGLAATERVRCVCGEVFPVGAHAPRAPRVFRCDQCGAALPAERRVCAYCSAEITLEERGLSGVCPGCSARLSAGARFCMECGLAIQPQRLSALREDVACPRCRGALRVRALGTQSAIECASCAGLWLSAAFFDELCARAESEDPPSGLFDGPAVPPAAAAGTQGYIPCLACGELMLRRNFGGSSGVLVDACKQHGVWLDHRELERALAFVRAGGLRTARQREVVRLEREAERRASANAGAGAPLLPEGPDRWEREGDVLEALAALGTHVLRWLR